MMILLLSTPTYLPTSRLSTPTRQIGKTGNLTAFNNKQEWIILKVVNIGYNVKHNIISATFDVFQTNFNAYK